MRIIAYRTQIILTAFLGILLYPNQNLKASHAAGGDISFRHIKDSTYRFTYKFYRDCSGVPAPLSAALCATNSCTGIVYSVGLKTLDTLPDGRKNGSPVSAGCPDFPTSCENGSLIGFEEWWYEADFTLPSRCDNWIFATSITARNDAITNVEVSGITSMYVEAIINNLDVQDNSSPSFTINPVPYVCVNSLFNYSHGAWDPDGDSMAFSIVAPRTGGGGCPFSPAPIPFTNPSYNLSTNPLSTGNTFQFSQLTGQFSFIPDLVQTGVITVVVDEYRHGKKLSSVMRDIQISVLPCNQPGPSFTIDTQSIAQGKLLNQGVHTCIGDSLSVCVEFTAPNTDALLSVRDNHDLTLPTAAISYAGLGTDRIRACLKWVPTLADTGWHFIHFTTVDSLCLPPGFITPNTFTLPIHVSVITQGHGDTVICRGAAASLHATGGNRFEWSIWQGDITSLSCTLCTSPIVQPAMTTSYIVRRLDLPDVYCRDRDTVTVQVDPGPPIDAGPDLVKCKNDTIQLSLDLNGEDPNDFTYEWSPNIQMSAASVPNPLVWDSVDRIYHIRAQHKGSACPSHDSVRVSIIPPPEILSPDGACVNEPITFQNADNSTPHQLWIFGDGTTADDRAPTHSYLSPGNYVVQLISIPCNDTVSKTIKIDSLPYVSFTADRDSLCAGGHVQFTPYARSGFDSLLWQFGTGPTIYSAFERIVHAFDQPGSYQVTLTARYPFCPDTSYTQTIHILPMPTVDLGADTSMCPNEPPFVLFNRQPESNSALRLWSTGSTDPQIAVNSPGIYWLKVSENGCSTVDSVLLDSYCHIGVPNVFSPNGDGVNDYFFPREPLAPGITQFKLQVFNRWGQLMFETDRPLGRGWDGKFNNVEQPEGVYVYQLAITFRNGQSLHYQGNVTLLR